MNKSSIINLRFNNYLGKKYQDDFYNLSVSLRSKYNNLISEISKPHNNNIDWWVNEVPSRNNLASPLFHYFCSIHFIIYLIKKNQVNNQKILVDTFEVKKVVDSILIDNNIHLCKVSHRKSLTINSFLKRIFSKYYCFYYSFMKILIAKLIINQKNIINKSLVLIDTFIIPGYTDSKRWYGVLWSNIPKEVKNRVFFIPTITKTTLFNLMLIYNKLKQNNEKYIIKEKYLHFRDLIFSLLYYRRIKKIKIINIKISKYDITDIINNCLFNPKDHFTIQESLLTYRFIYRVYKHKLKVKRAIDWFEGHIVDKAWNLGFHNFFPQAKTVAYRAFNSFPLYLCSYPTLLEYKIGAVPKVFALQSKKTEESVKEFIPELQTILIPSYKSSYVWDKVSFESRFKSKNIIITLPISKSSSLDIIKKIINISNDSFLLEKGFSFIIKNHPTNEKSNSLFNKNKFPRNIKISKEKSFECLLKDANILISEGSSTALEAISSGLPTIIIKPDYGMFLNPFQDGINKELYSICDSTQSITKALKKYLKMSDTKRKQLFINSKKIRSDYFELINSDGTDRLIDIKN
jgi:hypothetical protein